LEHILVYVGLVHLILCWYDTSQPMLVQCLSTYVCLIHISTYVGLAHISAYVSLVHLNLCCPSTSQLMLA